MLRYLRLLNAQVYAVIAISGLVIGLVMSFIVPHAEQNQVVGPLLIVALAGGFLAAFALPAQAAKKRKELHRKAHHDRDAIAPAATPRWTVVVGAIAMVGALLWYAFAIGAWILASL